MITLINIDFFRNIRLVLKTNYIIPDYHINSIKQLEKILPFYSQGLIFDLDQTIIPYDQIIIDKNINMILQELKLKYKCCFLSNSPKSPEKIDRLKKISLQADIKVIFTKRKKPDPSVFIEALKYFDLPPHKVTMIGDRLFTDIIGAKHVGLSTVLIDPIKPKSDPWLTVQLPRAIENIFLNFILWRKNARNRY